MDKFNPVAFAPKAHTTQKRENSPTFRDAYDALDNEFAALAAMPDVHLGIGATIGSVIATHKAIIPAAVGVDIGCGMLACRLSITANDIDEKSLKIVFDQICRDIPVGRAQHHDDQVLVNAARPFKRHPFRR